TTVDGIGPSTNGPVCTGPRVPFELVRHTFAPQALARRTLPEESRRRNPCGRTPAEPLHLSGRRPVLLPTRVSDTRRAPSPSTCCRSATAAGPPPDRPARVPAARQRRHELRRVRGRARPDR